MTFTDPGIAVEVVHARVDLTEAAQPHHLPHPSYTAAIGQMASRLEAMEARILQMAMDAQDSELNRQTEASEYERVIRVQRQSAVTAQSITDALVVQVQELHFAGLAREE